MNTPPAFRIAARTILELGAELISSDGVALYELIKNSVDANSPQVRISIHISLGHSKFSSLLDQIDGEISALKVGSNSRPKPREVTAVRRLQGNIYEALEENAPKKSRDLYSKMIEPQRTLAKLRRSLKLFYDETNWITVADRGEGMSLEDLFEIYLTIGTRSRQRMKREAVQHRGHAYLGEKGVGRLSTMRLGALLQVRTTKAGETHMNKLDIDWDHFSHDSDMLLDEVKVEPTVGRKKEDSTSSGTTVRIKRLRSDWNKDKFRSIILKEFSRLVDPFESKKAGRMLRLYYNGTRHYVREIERRLFEIAHAECKASLQNEDERPVLRGYVNYRLRARERSFVLRETELRSHLDGQPFSALMNLGPIKVEFWWYNRSSLTGIDDLKKRDLQELVKRWSGGLMLFRDGFRINPYGGPEDDWLSLDTRAFGSKGFKLNRQQVIGRVCISHLNNELIEQTNREGLTDTPEKLVLVQLLQQILFNEFKAFIDNCDTEIRIQEVTSLEGLEEKVEQTQDEIVKKIRLVITRVPSEKVVLTEVERLVMTLNGYITQARELAEEYQSDRAKFVYLAGIGLMVEFILHELGRATTHTLETLKSLETEDVENSLSSMLPTAFSTLSDQLTTIVKRVNTLDPLSTSRRQQKVDFEVFTVIRQILEARNAQAKRHKVKFKGNFDECNSWAVRGVRGMFIQIIENLLSNSFYWLDIQRDIEPSLVAYIQIDIDPEEDNVMITDNGTGVDPSSATEIFDAFVSHRPAREGKGLGLYISREIADYHNWTLDVVRESTVRRGRYNSFELNLTSNNKR